jgi:hypothetical protein
MKELLGTLSPAYGMIKGEGLFGNAVGVLPAIAKDMRDDRQKKKDEDKNAAGAQAMKKGGSVNENKMMKKMGRGLTKAAMQKVASKVVKGHEKRMHGMKSGGSVSASKRADGIAMKGKTKGRMV